MGILIKKYERYCPMNSELKQFTRKLIIVFAGIIISIMIFFLFYRFEAIKNALSGLNDIIRPIIWGIIFAYIINPLKRWINKLLLRFKISEKLSQNISTILSIVISLAIISLIIAFTVPQLVESISGIINNLPTHTENFISQLSSILPESIIAFIRNFLDGIANTDILDALNKYSSQIQTGIMAVGEFFKNFFIGIVIAIYLLQGGKRLIARLKKLAYAYFKYDSVNGFLGKLKSGNIIFERYVTGKLLESFIIFAVCAAFMALFGFPYPILISIIIAVTNIVPFVGPIVGTVLGALLVLFESPDKTIYFLIFIIILMQLDGNILAPKILGQSTGVSAFGILASILIGGGLFGLMGILVCVPVIAVIRYFLKLAVERRLNENGLPINIKEYEKATITKR